MEIWDAYNKDGTLAGCDLIRGEAISNGLYHLVSEIIVKHKDGMYLLMQRDLKRAIYPEFYEASAGGSALKGEKPYDAAVRELREETGIEVKELKQIYKCLSKDTIYYGYLCETDCEKESITLQEGETISYLWMSKKELLKFIESDNYIQDYKERMNGYFKLIR